MKKHISVIASLLLVLQATIFTGLFPVKVHGATQSQLFFEDFERGDFLPGKWVNGGAIISSSTIYQGIHSAQLNSGDSLKKTLSTIEYTNIKLKYARHSKSCESDDLFVCEWYDGETWNPIESYYGNSSWQVKEWSFPYEAAENPYFQIRFRTNYDNFDYSYIDNIEILGEKVNSLQNGLLIIVSNPLYKTGAVAQTINTYKNDVQQEYGWNNKIIKVNNVTDATADLDNATPESLKNLIMLHFKYGYKGIVFIGSEPSIPVPYIKINDYIVPTDLFYADMDSWGEKQENGAYLLIEDNTLYIPDMFYGRISPGAMASTLTEEATFVVDYLNKVHDYRINGSKLSQEQCKRSFTFSDSSDFKGDHNQKRILLGVTPEVHGFFDDTITTPAKLSEILQYGYQFGNLCIHSDNENHHIRTLQGNSFVEDNFTISHLKSITPKIHYINLYCCSACEFSDPAAGKVSNLGATYLFNKKTGEQNYMLNVTGSTGVWGPYPTDTYWNNISSGLSIGESFRRFLKYIVTSCNDLDAPKAVLLGDPTLRYKLPFVYNKAPYVAKNLASATNDTIDIRYKVEVGKTFEISPLDETGDTPIIEIEGLPSGANVQNTNGRFFWTPSYSDTGKVYNLKLTTYNKDDQNRIINKYVEEFSVAVVNYLFLDTFEDDTHTYNSWNIYNCLLQNLKAAQCEKSMQLNNNDTMTVSIDTTNYKDIKVEYFRATFSGLNSTAIFKCQWWDGYTWNTLESVTGIKPFQRQIFSLPSGASGNSDFKLRFLTNNKDNEYAFVDYVVVHGTNIP